MTSKILQMKFEFSLFLNSHWITDPPLRGSALNFICLFLNFKDRHYGESSVNSYFSLIITKTSEFTVCKFTSILNHKPNFDFSGMLNLN